MSLATTTILLAAAYLTGRPFVRTLILRRYVEQDLADYYRGMRSYRHELLLARNKLGEVDLMNDALEKAYVEACRLVLETTSWDDVVKSDQIAIKALDETIGMMMGLEPGPQLDVMQKVVCALYNTDLDLVSTRRLLARDIPKLNDAPVRRVPFFQRIFRLPTYPLTETIPDAIDRAEKYPFLSGMRMYVIRSDMTIAGPMRAYVKPPRAYKQQPRIGGRIRSVYDA